METQVVSINQSELKTICDASHSAIVTMLLLALRERSREVSNVSNLRDQLIRMGEKIVDDDYVAFWKGLEKAGIGNFIVGRRGNPDRFKWHYDLKNIARVAIEGKEEQFQELARKKLPSKPAPKKCGRKLGSKNKPKTQERVLFTITLSNGAVAEVIMPKNPTQEDIQQVYKTLRG